MKTYLLAIPIILSFFVISCKNRKVKEEKEPLTNILLEKYEYIQDENGSFIKDGYYKQWFENGQIETSGFYDNNNKTGDWKQWSENGQLESITKYKNGLKNGLKQEWSKDSTITESIYENDSLNGNLISKSKEGQILCKVTYIMGKQDGKVLEYFRNGKLKSETFFIKGIRIGSWNEYDITGKTIKNINFDHDTCLTLVGSWKGEDRKHLYIFNKDGSYAESFPMFANFFINDPITTKKGKYEIIGLSLISLYDRNFLDGRLYDIIAINDKEITLKSQSFGIFNLHKIEK